MARAGIGDETIIAAIQHSPTKFDTSPQSLILLKKAGISDRVLNAMLVAGNRLAPTAKTPSAQKSTEAPVVDNHDVPTADADKGDGNSQARAAFAEQAIRQATKLTDAADLFRKVLDAIGPADQISGVLSIRRKVKVDVTVIPSGRAVSFEGEATRVYPFDSAQISTVEGKTETLIVTDKFGYRAVGDDKKELTRAEVVEQLELMKVDPVYVAQHSKEFLAELACDANAAVTQCNQLRITEIIHPAVTAVWSIDPQTKRILSAHTQMPMIEQQTDLSDYRLVNGIYRPFHYVVTSNNRRSEVFVQQYEFNTSVNSSLFIKPTFPTAPPTPSPATAITATTRLTIRVLQEESVPYVQESGGGISTTCNIVGNANTSAYVNTYGNSASGNATTNWNQSMRCNSYDTTMRWPHVLNVMFVQASNGNSYIIGCDRAWRWSKCVPLRAGDTFNAQFTGKGIEVEAVNSKGKEKNPTYNILRSAVSR